MAGNLDDLRNLMLAAAVKIPDQALRIIEVEGKNFINKNFRDQGFTDGSLKKWQERKTTDSNGRDKMRYRTNRRGSVGELTRFGQKEIGRAILTGHNTGGNKLRNSFHTRREKLAVVFYTYKDYAGYHNEGDGNIPKRQFMGKSAYLDRKIQDKIKRTLDQLFRP
ncbi:phage virion morphogenesis protein [Chryseobacterium salviniae]|uniref:Phage morphogenesis protein n=1 Tax=Chryseobacterium salviniae TaxID=3101750 RepID=A0ABU6HU54_9FLAO|nr:phage morphogenesis protein [Chryseobacterium sp. T9W2-O]MEC3875948.1 phage morphogenesis protein [Chryseobacterium sp. T9W2-O]